MSNTPHGQTPFPVIPGYWDATGNIWTSVSAATPLPVDVGSAIITATVAVPARGAATQFSPVVTPTAATAAVAATATSRGKVIKNISPAAQIVYLGAVGVTVATGYPLQPGEFLTVGGSEAIYAVSDTINGLLAIFEEFSV